MKISISVADRIAAFTVLPFAVSNGFVGDNVEEAGKFIEDWLKNQLKEQYILNKAAEQKQQNQTDAEEGLR